MSQTFNVVKCFQCLVYQVDIEKKSTNKWTCKLCGSKQTLKQVFYQGESKECRLRVKTLSEMKGKQEELNAMNKLNSVQEQEISYNSGLDNNTISSYSKPFVSKWAKYLTKDDSDDNEDSDNENCVN